MLKAPFKRLNVWLAPWNSRPRHYHRAADPPAPQNTCPETRHRRSFLEVIGHVVEAQIAAGGCVECGLNGNTHDNRSGALITLSSRTKNLPSSLWSAIIRMHLGQQQIKQS